MSLHKIRIAIADDHQIIRDGLVSMLDPIAYEIVGEADNGLNIIELVQRTNPHIILMDIQMPKMNGIEATKIIIEKFPSIHIIALTMHGQDSFIIDMIDAGASGYLMKTAMKHEILEAINSVNMNKQYYCKTSTTAITKIIKRKNRNTKTKLSYNLSETDIKIINLICDEYNSEEIGRLLFLSKRTIDGARLRIQQKINVSSTAGIVKFALENGMYKSKE